ncbi:MAG: SpoVA/SpoVAEb family sporulation membrane protein [Clostridia bacterium]
MDYLKAFVLGGILCAIGQIFIDKTKLTPARILTGYVVAGVVLSVTGLYGVLAAWGGAGATVPLTGFGHLLAEGTAMAVRERGVIGAFTGSVSAAAAGIAASVFFALITAAIFKSHQK